MPTLLQNRLDGRFEWLRARDQGALVAYVTAGDPFPTAEGTVDLILTIANAGADIIELGIPYSDPLADGPTIQAASQRALDHGVTPPFVLDVVRGVRSQSDVPIILMTYYNPVLIYGLARFADAMVASGADGVILTDLPPEEADDWRSEADRRQLATIFLLAPTSTAARITAVASRMKSGFIYCVSRTGVTGARAEIPVELKTLLQTVRAQTTLPLCVGFGIATPEHVATIVQDADGAVIGSALVDKLHSLSKSPDWRATVTDLVGSWKQATERRAE